MAATFLRCAILLWSFVFSAHAAAHDVMGTVIYVDLGHSRVQLELELPVDQLRLAWGLPSEAGIVALPGTGDQIARYVLDHLQLETPDGAPFALSAKAGEVTLHDYRNWQHVLIDATPPAGGSPRDFVLVSDVIDHQVISHHVFVFLRRDVETGQLGDPVYLDTLHYQIHEAPIQRAPGSLAVGFGALFRLGCAHIAEGSDHLLFLFTLLLPATLAVGAGRRWGGRRPVRAAVRAILTIVTAFTLGHSLTLLVGALGVRLPSALVESLIAASVLVSAAHALVPLFPRREAWVALGFGLIHGLGFASALEGFGVDGATLLLTVLGFNLGVEALQALLVLVTLPSIFVLAGTRLGGPFRWLGATFSLLVALAWLAERALDIETPLLDYAGRVFEHGPWLIGGLAVLALLAQRFASPRAPAEDDDAQLSTRSI